MADRKQVNLKLTEEEAAYLDQIGPNRSAAMRTILASAMADASEPEADEVAPLSAAEPSRTYNIDPVDCLHKYRDMRGRCLACGHVAYSTHLGERWPTGQRSVQSTDEQPR